MQKVSKIRYYPLVVLIAFVMNAVLPFFAVYNLSAGNTDTQTKHLSSVFGESILICSGDGFKWVKLADLQSGKENPKPHPDYKCPLCYVARHGLKDAAMVSAAVAQDHDRNHASVSPAYGLLLTSLPLVSPLHVRAPPLSFIG